MFGLEVIGAEGPGSAPVLQIVGHGADLRSGVPHVLDNRLVDVLDVGHRLWGGSGLDRSLLERVVREGLDSDLVLGATPETTSPIGKVDRASFGRWSADQALWAALAGEVDSSTRSAYGNDAEFRVVDPGVSTASAIIVMRSGGEAIGAVAFGSDSFVVVVPPGATSVEVTYSVELASQRVEVDGISAALRREVKGEPVEQSLLWRLYAGYNTAVVDGISTTGSGRHPIHLRAVRGGAVLVGRMVHWVGKVVNRDSGDPTAKKRRIRFEHHPEYRDAANSCPDVRQSDPQPGAVVIAVHGTMACAVPLAADLRAVADPRLPVLRFEHDTWLPVHHNVNELVREITRLGTRRLLLVAHSRGGLVARHVADVLTSETDVDVRVVALGTPFLGTPVVEAVRVGQLGVKVLLGALRVVGGPVIDVGTRLAGFVLKTETPRGLEAMLPDSAYLSGFLHRKPVNTVTVSGYTDQNGLLDSYGLYLASGFSEAIFAKAPNDLVVSAESAAGRLDDAIPVQCDHFSYLLDPRVRNVIAAELRKFGPPEPPDDSVLTW
ncbi:hypothetical protein AB0K14_37470 [Actinosynnema sp. NPDC050801]|uniref:lipase family alpha/beta hydrolase n=1 Tax=unclassified Actinosynnema TaxID=2637065 RepID=UPI0033D766AF